ncbi:Uncharacterized protein FWK35_00002849 [Aphis craccivora]|uniref:Uncharacterized protein n=1 Tax=Aphis craccivora TaxID=307492 RepID=A0A6G0Z9V5_APHCR|nr:Uncharacterized protein FWK35_00002849 [Aphis craccivora]
MAVENMKQFVFRNKEVLMFIVGFGAMHIGWYNLQRNSTLNKAIAASREKETIKEYKRLEREIKTNWSEQPSSQQQQHQPQTAGIVLSSATTFIEKSSNTH